MREPSDPGVGPEVAGEVHAHSGTLLCAVERLYVV